MIEPVTPGLRSCDAMAPLGGLRRALGLAAFFFCMVLGCRAAFAVQSVRVPVDADAIDLSSAVEHFGAQGDRIQVSTAPGADGIVRRIEVSALEAGAQPAWIVFALTNDSDEQLTRLIVAPHFRFVGSGVVWPDLGSSRITTLTASQGSPPEREDHVDADVFALTLDPGTTVTYVAELRTPSLPQIYLWEPDAYKDKGASLTLYQGILIGIAGLLALFLTIVFVVQRRAGLSRRGGAGLGGFRLCLHRLRLLAEDFRLCRRGRARLARQRRGDHRRDADHLPLRLSEFTPLERAFPPYRAGLAAVDGGRGRAFPSTTRRSPRASRAFRSPPSRRSDFC